MTRKETVLVSRLTVIRPKSQEKHGNTAKQIYVNMDVFLTQISTNVGSVLISVAMVHVPTSLAGSSVTALMAFVTIR